MAIWHLGGREARGKTEGCCPGKGGAGDQVSWTLPFSRRTREKSVQGQSPPPGSGVDTRSLLGGGTGMGGGVEATPPSRRVRMQQRQHNDGGRGKGQEGRISSQEAQGPRRSPVGREQPPGGEMLGEPPAPFQSRDKRLEVVKSGSMVCRSCVHPPPRPTLGVPWPPVPPPHRARRRPVLPATSVCPGPLVPEAGGGGAEGGGVGAPVPRLVGGGVKY